MVIKAWWSRFFKGVKSLFSWPWRRRSAQKTSPMNMKEMHSNSFIGHLSDAALEKMTQKTQGIMGASPTRMPHITFSKMGHFSQEVAELGLPEEIQEALSAQKGSDGVILKFSNQRTHDAHVVRRLDGEGEEAYHRLSDVQERLGPYAVPLYHHRHLSGGHVYISETQFISGLMNIEDALKAIPDSAKRSDKLLEFSSKLITMFTYFEANGLRWPDGKISNIFVDPNTGELRVPDVKNFYTANYETIPLYAFTPAYMSPAVLRLQGKMPMSLYPDQLRFSVLKVLNTLVECCDAAGPSVETVKRYIRKVGEKGTIFVRENILGCVAVNVTDDGIVSAKRPGPLQHFQRLKPMSIGELAPGSLPTSPIPSAPSSPRPRRLKGVRRLFSGERKSSDEAAKKPGLLGKVFRFCR